MKKLNIFLMIILIIGMPFKLLAQGKKDIYLWWDFNDTKEIIDPADEDPWLEVPKQSTREKVKGDLYEITGLGKYVPGVKGSAFKFDGFSSYIEGAPDFEIEEEEIVFPDEITVESWVALGAYPWNWAPIITIGKYKVTGFYFGVDSRGRIGFHMSDATSVWHECNSKINTETGLGMDLGRWHHVVATYSPEEGIKIYLDGKIENSYDDIETQVHQLNSRLTQIHWALEQMSDAKFDLDDGEDLVMAVPARWDKESKDDPEGVLYISNKRLIFEQKEKIATKKVLFITTASELVQQTLINQLILHLMRYRLG